MKRSENKILTTYVGALPRPQELGILVTAKTNNQAHDEAKLAEWLRSAVGDVVKEQVNAGIDVISDGEYGKTNWTTYIGGRLGGYDVREPKAGDTIGSGTQAGIVGRDRKVFNEFYADYDENAARIRQNRAGGSTTTRQDYVNIGPVTYTEQASVGMDVTNLKAAIGSAPVVDAFMPSIGPDNVLPQNLHRLIAGSKFNGPPVTREEWNRLQDGLLDDIAKLRAERAGPTFQEYLKRIET